MFNAAYGIFIVIVSDSMQWNNPNQDGWPLKVVVWPETGHMNMTAPNKTVLKVWVATVHVLNRSPAIFHY